MKYLKGIIGGIIGGLVASIPWILLYVYGSMMVSFLAALIGAGGLYGYRMFNGRVDRKLPTIITVISVGVVVLVTTVIIPMLLLIDSGYSACFYNLKLIYFNGSSGIVKDLVISIIFTFIGISGLVKKLSSDYF